VESTELNSKALRQAALRSDRIRITAIVIVLCLLFVSTVVRRLILDDAAGVRGLAIFASYFGAMLAYELMTLRRVTRALADATEPGPARWIGNVIVESLFPTIGLAVIIATGMTRPYAGLVAPVVPTYFLIIALSTLRLSPALARLSGLCSAVGYSAVAIYVFARYPTPDLGTGMYPIEFYVGNTVVILVAGLVAGEVARQIRGHVHAALREAHEVERIRAELETARTIQQGLLPGETPRLAGYDVAGWNQPADQTGGDYFGWQDLPDGRVAFTLADVTGHGIGAALVAATCHAYARAGMTEQSDLGALLSHLNRLLCDDLPPGKLVTFVAAALEPAEGRLEILSAGHGPLLLYTASDDRVQAFGAHGIPFGIVPTMPYGPAQQIHLEAGDLLVLLTDGFFEWENAGHEDFGIARLQEAIRGVRNLPASQIIASLHDAVVRFSGGTKQMDDLTAVVVKRLAAATAPH
jgi:serine phosphatase RsbU (regulator of sigma subunit)